MNFGRFDYSLQILSCSMLKIRLEIEDLVGICEETEIGLGKGNGSIGGCRVGNESGCGFGFGDEIRIERVCSEGCC